MRSKSLSIGLMAVLAVFSASNSAAQTGAPQESVLHSFNGTFDVGGSQPSGGVILDGSGNLYGLTFYGGTLSDGTVYELSPQTNGWIETVLFSFDGMGGGSPVANPTFDAHGNLYGTTFFGGAFGFGTVFEISPSSGGGWTETGVHDFSNHDKDGEYPRGGVVFDVSGNLYGTTPSGGAGTYGAVFELTPNAGAGWTEKLLHSFNNKNGGVPYGAPVLNASGNLYGTASAGGGTSSACNEGCGTVFELSPAAGGGRTMKVLHNFTTNSADGQDPYTGVILDPAGNLYGTTGQGGKYNFGIVYELTPVAGGGWQETILHNFSDNGIDGNSPSGPLTLDAAGNLYGTTSSGGAHGYGTVFKLTRTTRGGWQETILHNFNDDGIDGYFPGSGVVLDGSGNIYGTTGGGGAYGYGAVYQVVP